MNKKSKVYLVFVIVYAIMALIACGVAITSVATQAGILSTFICFGCAICVGILAVLIGVNRIMYNIEKNKEKDE